VGDTLEQKALRESSQELEVTKVPQSRALSCVALRIAGASFSAIAEVNELGSPAIARQIVEEALAASVDENKDIAKLRALHSLRLDRLLQSVMPQAVDKKNVKRLDYLRAALSIIDRQAKLHGTDAPQRLEVYTPDNQRKEEWLRRALEEIGGIKGLEEEADIIDAEVVDGDE